MHDVVKAIRHRPFGEWVVVYYDARKADLKALFQRVKDGGCKDATQVKALAGEKGKLKATVENPLSVVGDFFVITLAGADAAPEVSAPDGWTVVTRSATRVEVQSPGKAKPGEHTITVGGIALKVELVSRVP